MNTSKNKDIKKNKFSQTSFFNFKINEKSKLLYNEKNNHEKSETKNNSHKIKSIDNNLLIKSKSKISKPKKDNSFNNSVIINQKSNVKTINKDNDLNKSFNLLNGNLNSSKSKIYNMKINQKGIEYNPNKQKQTKIFKDSSKNKYKKIENIPNGISIINYKKTTPNIKQIYKNKVMKDNSGEHYNNFSNSNNNNSFNMNSIDHLFYRPVKNKAIINNKNNKLIDKLSSNINPINYLKINNSKISNLNQNKSFSKKLKSDIHTKTNQNDIQKNNSALNIRKENINYIKNYHLNDFENKNKKKLSKNNFKPQNIFSKYKNKKKFFVKE